MEASTALLSVQNLTVGIRRREKFVPVKGLDFRIMPGQTYALVGESGTGKSLSAHCITQLLSKNIYVDAQSRILWGDEDLCDKNEYEMRQIRGSDISMIFQEPMVALNPVMTIGSQLKEVLTQNTPKNKIRDEMIQLLGLVGISEPELRLRQYPHELSGGMKQRVLIAIALAGKPKLLIADEPTTALDVTIQAQILQLLKSLQETLGMSILLITHDLGVVRAISHRVGVMYKGHIVEEADTQSFFTNPQHPYSKQLFASLPSIEKRNVMLSTTFVHSQESIQTTACRFVERCPHRVDLCQEISPIITDVNKDHQVRCHMIDQMYQPLFKGYDLPDVERDGMGAPSVISDEVVLEVKDLKVYFPIKKSIFFSGAKYVKAVDGVNFNLRKGSTLAVVGESGCGKTTLGKAIMRLIDEGEGKVMLQGESLQAMSASSLKKARQKMQMIFQDPYSSMNPKHYIEKVLEEGMLAQDILPDRVERLERMQELLKKVGLPEDSLERYPHEFSGGQRQRISIGRALALDPQVLILDEPTSALDVSVQAQILNLLKELQRAMHLSYLFISHDISVVSYLADEIMVMYLGRVVEYGSASEVINNPQHPYTKALLSAVPNVTSGLATTESLGEQPSPVSPPLGCHFHPRCPKAMPICETEYPRQRKSGSAHVSCHLYSE